jgi:hypothetical protein
MKRIIIWLHAVLILVFAIHVYSLWADMTQDSSEEVRLEDYQMGPPPDFKARLSGVYPPLFDVEAKGKEEAGKDGKGRKGKGKDPAGKAGEEKDQLKTDIGTLRLRAIFTVSDAHLALLEIVSNRATEFIEARENDTIHGYRVLETAPGHILVQPEQGGDEIKLVIFDRERNRTSPGKPAR